MVYGVSLSEIHIGSMFRNRDPFEEKDHVEIRHREAILCEAH